MDSSWESISAAVPVKKDFDIRWDRMRVDSNLSHAKNGLPPGYRLPRQLRKPVNPRAFNTPAREVLSAWRKTQSGADPWQLGTYIPFVWKSRPGIFIVQTHPWTTDRRTGKRKPFNGPGVIAALKEN